MILFSLSLTVTGVTVRGDDLLIYPLLNAEVANTPDGELVSNIGTPFVIGDGVTLSKTLDSNEILSGKAAIKADIDFSRDSSCFQVALHGFGPSPAYWASRDLRLVRRIDFALDNRSGKAFDLILELKDHRDSDDHKLSIRGRISATERLPTDSNSNRGSDFPGRTGYQTYPLGWIRH